MVNDMPTAYCVTAPILRGYGASSARSGRAERTASSWVGCGRSIGASGRDDGGSVPPKDRRGDALDQPQLPDRVALLGELGDRGVDAGPGAGVDVEALDDLPLAALAGDREGGDQALGD